MKFDSWQPWAVKREEPMVIQMGTKLLPRVQDKHAYSGIRTRQSVVIGDVHSVLLKRASVGQGAGHFKVPHCVLFYIPQYIFLFLFCFSGFDWQVCNCRHFEIQPESNRVVCISEKSKRAVSLKLSNFKRLFHITFMKYLEACGLIVLIMRRNKYDVTTGLD
jgi:hypothetical protein